MNNEQDMDLYVADDFDEQTDNQPRWFILGKDKKKFGKYTTKQMIDYFNQGKLNENSTVACTGMKAWAKFKDTELMQYINTFDEDDFIEEDFGSEYKQSMHNDAKTTFEYPSNINIFAYAILVCIILAIVGTNKTPASLGLWGIATLGYLLFWYLDLQRLKRIVGFEKINGIWQIWGFLFIPVYLFIRDKKLDKKYKFGWLSIGAIVVGAIAASILSTPPTTKSIQENVKEETFSSSIKETNNDTAIIDTIDNTQIKLGNGMQKRDLLWKEENNHLYSDADLDICYEKSISVPLGVLNDFELKHPERNLLFYNTEFLTYGYIVDIGDNNIEISDGDVRYVVYFSDDSTVDLGQLQENDMVYIVGYSMGTGSLLSSYIAGVSRIKNIDETSIQTIQEMVKKAFKDKTTLADLEAMFVVENISTREQNISSSDNKATYTVLYENFNTHDDNYGDGSWSFYVQAIKNDSNTPIYVKDAKYEMNDKDGHLIKAEDVLSVTPNIIEPGETGYIYEDYMSCDKPSSQVGQPTIKYEVKAIDEHSMRDKFILSDTSITTNFGHQLTGRVTNNTGEHQGWVEVTVLFFDENNKMVDWDHSNIMDLSAGDTKSFDTGGSESYEKYRYEVYVEPAFETPLW